MEKDYVAEAKQRVRDCENTISLEKANSEFPDPCRVGEYVAWWISADGQASLTLVATSYPTEDEVLKAAAENLDADYLADDEGNTLRETGDVSVQRVISDEDYELYLEALEVLEDQRRLKY